MDIKKIINEFKSQEFEPSICIYHDHDYGVIDMAIFNVTGTPYVEFHALKLGGCHRDVQVFSNLQAALSYLAGSLT